MNPLRLSFFVPVVALALAACATKPAGPPFDGVADDAHLDPAEAQKAADKKPEYKKPVRMTGRGDISSISLENFFMLQQSGKALIFDARPAFFYGLGHIPGAINLPAKKCDEKIAAREQEIKAALAEGKTIVVYCTNLMCPDARTLAIHISGFGHPAKIYSGGWDGWKEAGMPVE